MPDLDSLGAQLRTDPPVDRTAVATLERAVRGRRRRQRRTVAALAAAVVLVVSAGAVHALATGDDRKPVRTVGDPSTTAPIAPEPTLALLRSSDAPPTGPVHVVTTTVVGGTRAWVVAYDAKPTRVLLQLHEEMNRQRSADEPTIPAPTEAWCTAWVTADAIAVAPMCTEPGGDGASPRGVTFGAVQVGGRDVVTGRAGPQVAKVELRFRSGRIATTVAHPVPGRGYRIWLLPLSTSGDSGHGMQRIFSSDPTGLARVSTIVGGKRFNIFPNGLPPVDHQELPVVGEPTDLALPGGVGLTVDHAPPVVAGRPVRTCTTPTLGAIRGVRTCLPPQAVKFPRVRWAYTERLTEDRWVLVIAADPDAGVAATLRGKRVDLHLEPVDDLVFTAFEIHMEPMQGSDGNEGVLTTAHGTADGISLVGSVAVGGREPVTHPGGPGIDPPFSKT